MGNLSENICSFIQNQHSLGDIHILHYVLETKKQRFDGWKSVSHHKIHFVIEGEGVLHTHNGDYKLAKGDVFFCLPSAPYAIQSVRNFKYAYIGLIGEKANALFHKFNINIKNCVFRDYIFLSEMWEKGFEIPIEVANFYFEGVFLSTMALIAKNTLKFDNTKKNPQTASLIKKYIDENFSSQDLSLESICRKFSYSNKYISKIFKKEFMVSFKEYLNTIRVNNACALMNKGYSSVKDIAFLCGFNDALYFSKVFKTKMKVTPREYISSVEI